MSMTPQTAGPREWAGLVVLTLPALLAAMDLSVLFMAVPKLTTDLDPSGTQLLWIMDVYGFFIAGLLITMGVLGDRIGRRRLLMIGAAAFGAASLLAAYSTSAEMLIVARALLGVGGATLAPSTLALIRNMFVDQAQRRTAIAVWAGAFSAGFPLGAIIGGLLVEHFWWGSVFLINIPVMVLLLICAPILLPEYKDPDPGPFDLPGAGLSIAAMITTIWGLKEFAKDGWSLLALVAVVVGVGLGLAFVRRQARSAAPMLDVGLFRYPAFSASIGTNVALVFGAAGIGMLVAQFLQLSLGYRPFVAALWMLPMVGAMTVGIVLGTVGARRVRPALVIAAGLAVTGVGFACLIGLPARDSIGQLLLGYSFIGLGMGVAITLVYNLVIATAPPAKAGAAAAVNEAGAEFGGAMGIAVLGSLATAAYRREVTDSLPADLPEGVGAAAAETLAGAMELAEGLPEPQGAALIQVAQEAFAQGVTATAMVGAVIMVVGAVVAGIALRRVSFADLEAAEHD